MGDSPGGPGRIMSDGIWRVLGCPVGTLRIRINRD